MESLDRQSRPRVRGDTVCVPTKTLVQTTPTPRCGSPGSDETGLGGTGSAPTGGAESPGDSGCGCRSMHWRGGLAWLLVLVVCARRRPGVYPPRLLRADPRRRSPRRDEDPERYQVREDDVVGHDHRRVVPGRSLQPPARSQEISAAKTHGTYSSFDWKRGTAPSRWERQDRCSFARRRVSYGGPWLGSPFRRDADRTFSTRPRGGRVAAGRSRSRTRPRSRLDLSSCWRA